MTDRPPESSPGTAGELNRRRVLGLGGGLLAGATLGVLGTAAGSAGLKEARGPLSDAPALPFDTHHAQQGITTPQPRHLALAALDLAPELTGRLGRQELGGLLRDWSTAARTFVAGDPLTAALGPSPGLAAPADTGDAVDLAASGLTISFGFGPGLFDAARALTPAAARPRQLQPLPAFRGDALEGPWSGGELLIAAAADDPQVALHAVRNLARIGRGAVGLRWLQRGFLPDTRDPDGIPRNLMGFKDGISMLDHQDAQVARRLLWAGAESPAWMRDGGTYLVVRRIRMLLESWDRTALTDQEAIIGRSKAGGELPSAPEHRDPAGLTVNAPGYAGTTRRSHVVLARSAAAAGQQLLRRPYSYADGVDPATGQLDGGLLFLAFQRRIDAQFTPMQALLSTSDALSAYSRHIGSATFALPPASRGPRDWVGSGLFG